MSDEMLSQGTVDFRSEERRARHYACTDPEGDWIHDQQDSICTRTDDCAALADAHEPDCPVERRLREELGF